jgi:hypothetical protein
MSRSILIEGLSVVCRERLLDEKWLLAPSLRTGHQWMESLSRAGQAAVNVHIKTLKSMALDLAAPQLSAKKLTLLSGRAGTLIADSVFRLLRQEGLEYLGELRASTGLADVIFGSLDSIRMAGLDLDDVAPASFEVGEKGRDLQRILTAYRQSLTEAGLIDYADVLRFAIERVRTDHSVLANLCLLVLVPEDLPARGLERQLLQLLPDDRRLTLAVDAPPAGGGY